MVRRIKTGPNAGLPVEPRWRPTPKIAPYRKQPVHDPLATSQRQDHTGHGCHWDPTRKKGAPIKPEPNALDTRSQPNYAQSRYQPGTGKDPHSGRAVTIKQAKSAERMARNARVAKEDPIRGHPLNANQKHNHVPKAEGNTRVCPKCSAVVKGNGWHLTKHMNRHK